MKKKSVLSGLKIAVIGAGNMGQALVRGLVEESVYPQNVSVFDVDRRKTEALRRELHIRPAKTSRQCVSLADVVVLAVKPQTIEQVAGEITSGLGRGALVISIAAGVTLSTIRSYFKKPVALIRVMPNMPALVGAGMSAFSVGRHVNARQRKVAEGILSAVGEVVQVQERLLDLVTAVSGSGPAYFFLLSEKLIETAHQMGLKVDVAKKLVYQTALGSGRIMTQEQEDPEDLVSRVASKGGTTEAALKVFRRQGFGKVVHDAVKAAFKRSQEISKGR